MKLHRRALRAAALSSLILLLSGTDARAYLDPGTGSYILQILVAGLLGAAFAVKTFWRSIKAFLAGLLLRGKKDDKGH